MKDPVIFTKMVGFVGIHFNWFPTNTPVQPGAQERLQMPCSSMALAHGMESVLKYLDWTSVGLAFLGGLVSLFLLEIYRLNSYRSQIPPGPKPLPFVGNLPQLSKDKLAFIRSDLNSVTKLRLALSRACTSQPGVPSFTAVAIGPHSTL
ncbi:hypothetical protein AOLI_G00153930 [Acnodon oligacanthus]